MEREIKGNQFNFEKKMFILFFLKCKQHFIKKEYIPVLNSFLFVWLMLFFFVGLFYHKHPIKLITILFDNLWLQNI